MQRLILGALILLSGCDEPPSTGPAAGPASADSARGATSAAPFAQFTQEARELLANNQVSHSLAFLACCAVGVVAGAITWRLLRHIATGAEPHSRRRFLGDLASPLGLFCIWLGARLGTANLVLPETWRAASGNLWTVSFLMLLLYAAHRSLDASEALLRSWAARTRSTRDDALVPLVMRGARITIWGLFALLLIVTFIDKAAQLVAAGFLSIGLPVGLAFQDPLKNLVGHVWLTVRHPFEAGDDIAIAGARGRVREIGLMVTILDGEDRRPILLPNAKFLTEALTLHSGKSETR